VIEVGEPAPDFTLPDQAGEDITLSDLRGQQVLLYFYPADDTPGCTTQACDIRDRWSAFGDRGVTVLGISPDTVESHQRFRDKYDLPHTLLADPDHDVMEAYDAWGEKNLYGKTTVGAIRSSVLVDPDGTVVKHWRRVGAKKHAEQVLAYLDQQA
jgi:thioredoxin-dependent peroxiredoxin